MLDDEVDLGDRHAEAFDELALGLALARSSKRVRRVTTSRRCSMKCSSAALRSRIFGLPADDREDVHAERALQRGQLVELVEHDLRERVALELDDDAHAVAIGLVAQVADALEPLLAHELGDLA